MTDDVNPKYGKIATDAARTRYGCLVAGPAFFYAAASGSWELRRDQGLHSGGRSPYRPVLDGDEVHTTNELERADPVEGPQSGNKGFNEAEGILF